MNIIYFLAPYWPLIVATVLGSFLGLERSVAHKRAGMRTYALVSLGSALFVVVSQQGTAHFIGALNFDPMRVASQIVVGIGFLGGGLIIFHGTKLEGLTTAAGLWVAAGIGMAAGFELYQLAAAVTALSLIVLTVFWPLEQFVEREADMVAPIKVKASRKKVVNG